MAHLLALSSNAEYSRFGVATMHNMTDASLVLLLHNVNRLAVRLQPDLVAVGMTPALVAGVAQAASDLVALIMAQAEAIEDCDRAVDLRVAKGNALYAMLAMLAEVGKRLWFNVDESRYNEYLIYPRKVRPKAEEVEAEVAPGATVTLSVRALRANSAMEVTNAGAAPLLVLFSAQPSDGPAEAQPSIMLAPGQVWRGSAAALGYVAGKQTYLNVINTSELDGTVVVLVG